MSQTPGCTRRQRWESLSLHCLYPWLWYTKSVGRSFQTHENNEPRLLRFFLWNPAPLVCWAADEQQGAFLDFAKSHFSAEWSRPCCVLGLKPWALGTPPHCPSPGAFLAIVCIRRRCGPTNRCSLSQQLKWGLFWRNTAGAAHPDFTERAAPWLLPGTGSLIK